MLNNKFLISNKGASIYLAVVIMVLILAVSLGINAILVSQLKVVKSIGDSVIAFYVAETGIERVLFEREKNNSEDNSSYSGSWNNTYYQATIYASSSEECKGSDARYFCIKSLGTFGRTHRAIQVTR